MANLAQAHRVTVDVDTVSDDDQDGISHTVALLVATQQATPIERSNFRQRIWIPAVSIAGMTGMRFHDLRHTAGTLAAQTGGTTKELMVRMGPASPQAAMVYQHAAEDRDRVIADRLAAMAEEAGLAPR